MMSLFFLRDRRDSLHSSYVVTNEYSDVLREIRAEDMALTGPNIIAGCARSCATFVLTSPDLDNLKMLQHSSYLDQRHPHGAILRSCPEFGYNSGAICLSSFLKGRSIGMKKEFDGSHF